MTRLNVVCWLRSLTLTGVFALASASASAPAQEPLFPRPALPFVFNRLHDYEELVELLQKLVASRPNLLSMQSVGKSVEGRDLWCVTIQNPATGEEACKPAIYLDANIHGNEIQGGEVCLYVVWYLCEQYDRNPRLRELVDHRVFYILPTVNPDGRAHWFQNANTPSSSRSGKSPHDDDRDGLEDEDGLDDLDGDGQVSQMRRRSTTGSYRIAPGDSRLLVRLAPGEEYQGPRYELLGEEGLDNDGDGRVNEDPPGGYDMNRNYPADWRTRNEQYGSGDFPLCWPETRAVSRFLLDHPNIGAVVAFHNAAGMILRGPGDPSRQDQHPRGDERTLQALGDIGVKLLPFYRNLITHKDLYSVHGGFTDWTYEHLGIFSYVVELWNNDQLLGRDAASGSTLERAIGQVSQDDQLFAADRLLHGTNYVEWHPFNHPLYGAIEIGGFVKQSQRVPPPFLIEEMCHRNSAFVLYLADQLPMVDWDKLEAVKLTDDTYSVTASIRNERMIPTVSEQAAARKIGQPDRLEIKGESLAVLSGGKLLNRDTGEFQPARSRPAVVTFEQGIAGRGLQSATWIVRGSGEATVTFRSQKGGTSVRKLDLP